MRDESAADATGGDPGRARIQPRVVAIAAVAVAVVALGAIVAVRLLGSTPAAEPAAVDGPLVEVDDEAAGLAISYPESWDRLEPADEMARLLVTPNGRDSLLVRSVALNMGVEDDDIDGVREFTRSLVADGDGVEMIAGPTRVELAGTPGWHYLYRFRDAGSDTVGIHSHYFLFDDDRMVVLVFQALPAESFERLAPTFDAIAESLRLHEG